MKQPMVITNLRIPEVEYRQIKAMAAETGMSFNEYITYVTHTVSTNRQLFNKPVKPRNSYKMVWKIIKTKAKNKPMGWSKEDEAIYSV